MKEGEFKLGEIYMIKNKITEEMYVGQTKYTAESRYKGHIAVALNTNRNLKLYNSMRKYGIDNFELIVLERDVKDEDLDTLEIYYISKYDTFNNGYNYTKGGGGIKGYHHSEETRKKMGIAIHNSMWKINTPERTAKIRAAQKGRKFTQEHRQHIKDSIGDRFGKNNSFYGKRHSEYTKNKISDANTKYYVIQILDDNNIKKFNSVKEAAQYCIDSGYTTAKLSSVMYRIYVTCIGKQKVCYNYKWKYEEKCID